MTTRNIIIGRTNEAHLEVIEKFHGGIKLAVMKDEILSGLVWLITVSKNDAGYVVAKVDGYCDNTGSIGSTINILDIVHTLLSTQIYARIVQAN